MGTKSHLISLIDGSASANTLETKKKKNMNTKIIAGHIVRPSSPADATIHPLRRRIVRVFLAILSPIDPESSIIGNPRSKYDFVPALMYIAIPNPPLKYQYI
tara:strand:- start:68 stop:373 length:306 start_codon:yes stop_codon:yes gene_type:complete